MKDLKTVIRNVQDFPKEGVVFRDISTLLADPATTRDVADAIAGMYRDVDVDIVAGIEARGFIFGALVADRLGVPLAMVRKPGKLPYQTIGETYDLEYGTDTVEIHTDAVGPNQQVLLVDDLLATGGTMAACCRLVEKLGAVVAGCAFVVELSFLRGREKLGDRRVTALVDYTSE
jgi:adenine phosphoribosyltransferase